MTLDLHPLVPGGTPELRWEGESPMSPDPVAGQRPNHGNE